MLRCLPEEPWLNYLVSNALSLGATPGDVGDAIAEVAALLGDGASGTDRAVQEAWHDGWLQVARRIEAQAEVDRAAGHGTSAAQKRLRATLMLTQSAAQLPVDDPRKRTRFEEARTVFRDALAVADDASEFVTLSHRGADIDALFVRPEGVGPWPVLVFFNGYHTTLEWYYLCGITDELRKRGIASLLLDQPGSGSAFIVRNIPIEWDTEILGGVAIDYLGRRGDVDAGRIGVIGSSFGGYFAPRAAANEPRFRLCVVWGVAYRMLDHPASILAGRAVAGETLAADEAEGLREWMLRAGTPDAERFLEFAAKVDLSGELHKITAPVLIVHGENDGIVPPGHVERMASRLTSSTSVTTRIIAEADGGAEHCQLDNMPLTLELIADWAADHFSKSGRQA